MNVWLGLGGLALIVLGVAYARWLLSVDPFARFRPDPSSPLANVAIRLLKSELRSYVEGRLVGQCRVARLDVRRDRTTMDLSEVTDGVYFGPEGELRFSCPEAEYSASRGLLRAPKGGRVWNKDMDLQVDTFVFQERHHTLRAPGKITGTLYGGKVVATSLDYSTSTGAYATGPIEWKGEVEITAEAGGQGQKVAWKINALKSGKGKGGVEHYEEVEATDGEVLVKAPVVDFDRNKDILIATGRVYYYGEDSNLVCDKLTVYRKEKRAVLEGNVTMILKPKEQTKLEVVEIQPFRPTVPEEILKSRPAPPDVTSEEQRKRDEEVRSSKNVRKYPISLHAERIEYWYAKGGRRAEITGSPEAYQEMPSGWRRVWGPRAYYDGEKETLKIVSTEGKKDTRILTSVGDDLVATWFQFSTKEDADDEWEGWGIEGEVVVNEDEERRRSGAKPPPSTKPPLSGAIGGRPPR